VVEDARLALGAVASYPIAVDCSALIGKTLDDETLAEFAKAAAKPGRPLDNTDYHLSWRKQVLQRYVIGALRELRGDPVQDSLLARTAARVLPIA